MKRVLTPLLLSLLLSAFLHAENMDSYSSHWKILEAEGRFAEASQYFQKAIARYPREAWLYVFAGYSELRLAHFRDAIVFLEKARELAPQNEDIKSSLGHGYALYADHLLKAGGLADAAAHYALAVDLLATNAHYRALYALSLSRIAEHEKALAELSAAVKLGATTDPNNLPAIRECVKEGGVYFRARQKTELAISFGTLGIEAFPGDSEISIALFFDHAGQKNFKKAEAVAKQASNQLEKNVLLQAIRLFEGDDKRAESALKDSCADILADYMIDELVASVYRTKAALYQNYENSSIYIEKMKEYGASAVRKYFKIHPYRQSIHIIPPLRGEFTLVRSDDALLHTGLAGHYSFDLEKYEDDSFGVPVVAACDGIVVKAESAYDDSRNEEESKEEARKPVSLTNLIKIDHDGIVSVYENLKFDSILVSPGDRVRTGQIIGEIGKSGANGRPYLHFALTTREGITLPARFSRLAGRLESEKKYTTMSELFHGYIYVTK